MRRESVDHRVLGAVRIVDATSELPVRGGVVLEAPGVRFVRNRRGDYGIWSAPGFDAYSASFREPLDVDDRSVEVTVKDPSRQYLPRTFALELPRNAGTPPTAPGPLFAPRVVKLYPAPRASTSPGWTVLRVSVREREEDELGLAGAWIHLTDVSDAASPHEFEPRAEGLTDDRGEALVAVGGIRFVTVGSGGGANEPVLRRDIEARLDVFVDYAYAHRVRDALAAGTLPEGAPLDPKEVREAREGGTPSWTQTLRLASGQRAIIRILAPPPAPPP